MTQILQLPLSLQDEIKAHLGMEYRNIFTPAAIEAHFEGYVSGESATAYWEQICPILKKDQKILDIGSGYGAFVLIARAHGYDAKGIELADFDNNCARRRLESVERDTDPASVFIKGSAFKIPFPDESFDIITLWNVIEHLPDYRQALKEAIRVLKKGGYIVIEAPNYASFRTEAHYHVPWLPWLPKKIGELYLHALGRNPSFLKEHIYYCSISGVRACLKNNGCQTSSLLHKKLLEPELISRPRLRKAIETIKKFKLTPVLESFLSINQFFPFRSAIQCIGEKNDQ